MSLNFTAVPTPAPNPGGERRVCVPQRVAMRVNEPGLRAYFALRLAPLWGKCLGSDALGHVCATRAPTATCTTIRRALRRLLMRVRAPTRTADILKDRRC
eukprot:790872-Pleurochrysis_carterae.AAC.5